jgi:ADP-ribose pyrophosphatase YjhB (NUDIX family)
MRQFTRTGAYALLIQNNQILLTRKTGGPFIHLWDLPGGGIEHTEPPLQALHRELLEETALQTTDPTLLTVLSHHGKHEDYHYHHIGIIYRLHNISPTNTTPEDESRWFPIPHLDPSQLTPFVRLLLDQKFI